jgi:hypothetical protein
MLAETGAVTILAAALKRKDCALQAQIADIFTIMLSSPNLESLGSFFYDRVVQEWGDVLLEIMVSVDDAATAAAANAIAALVAAGNAIAPQLRQHLAGKNAVSVLVSMLENPSLEVSAAALHAINSFLCDQPGTLQVAFQDSDRKMGLTIDHVSENGKVRPSCLPPFPTSLPAFLPSFLPFPSCLRSFFLPAFLPFSFLPSFLPSFSFQPSFLPAFLFLPSLSFFPCPPSFLPSFLPSFPCPPSFLPSCLPSLS